MRNTATKIGEKQIVPVRRYDGRGERRDHVLLAKKRYLPLNHTTMKPTRTTQKSGDDYCVLLVLSKRTVRQVHVQSMSASNSTVSLI
jgi:hypothetical protein